MPDNFRTEEFKVEGEKLLAKIKELIHEVDPAAFVVIGQAHEALGEGFKTLGEAK